MLVVSRCANLPAFRRSFDWPEVLKVVVHSYIDPVLRRSRLRGSRPLRGLHDILAGSFISGGRCPTAISIISLRRVIIQYLMQIGILFKSLRRNSTLVSWRSGRTAHLIRVDQAGVLVGSWDKPATKVLTGGAVQIAVVIVGDVKA